MSFKLTLLLLLLVGLVAGGYFLTKPSHVDPSTMDEPLLPDLAWQDVQAIKILSLRRTTEYLFERKPDDTFWLAEPVRDLASAAYLNSLRDIYGIARRRLFRQKALVTEKDLKDTGLAEPRAFVEFRTSDRTVRVDVGEEDLVETAIFVRIDGDIYRSTSALWSATQVNQEEARERSFFRATPFDLQALSITRDVAGKKETLRFERTGPQEFGLVAPVKSRANASVTGGLIAMVLALRANRFGIGKPRELATIGLDPPRYHIEVATHTSSEVADVAALPEGGGGVHAFLPGRDVIAIVEMRELATYLEAPLDQFRSRYLFPGPAAQAHRLRIDTGGGAALAFERKEAGGHDLLAPVKRPANATELGALLEAIDSLHVTEFVGQGEPPPEAGLSGDVVRIEMTAERAAKPVVVRLGAAKGDSVFARRDDEDWTVLVSAQPLERLRKHWTTYVERKVLERPILREDVARVEVLVGGQTVRTIHREGTGWREEPAGRAGHGFEDLFEYVADPRAGSLVPGLADEVLRERTPDLTLRIIRPDLTGPEAVRHEMSLYRVGDATWLRVRDDVLVFVLNPVQAGLLLALKG